MPIRMPIRMPVKPAQPDPILGGSVIVRFMSNSVSVVKDVEASASRVFDMVTHLERMGEWSPEAKGGTWAKGASGPAVGARFIGTNGNEKSSWKTTAIVTEYAPSTRFSFRVIVGPVKVAKWVYQIEPLTDSSCRVTHEWSDQRNGFAKFMGKRSTGIGDREAHNRANMTATLDAISLAASK